MSSSNPRDMREWMREIERRASQARQGIAGITAGLPATVADIVAGTLARHPTAPIELTWQTDLYTDSNGRNRARLLLDFPDVTKATDGTDITVPLYELWGRDETNNVFAEATSSVPGLAVPGLTLPGLSATTENLALIAAGLGQWTLRDSSTISAFRSDRFLPGSIWRFHVRAMGDTVTAGQWSIEFVVQFLKDTTPPPQPTAPVLKIARGTITVSWDGLSVLGSMPADFSHLNVAHGTTSSPVAVMGTLGAGGGFLIATGMPYYTPQFFRFQAVDESGNASPWSEQAVGYTVPLVDTDVILSKIDAAKTLLVNVDAGVSILSDTITTRHLSITEDMTAAMAEFLHVKAGMLEANEIWADSAWFGVADAILVRSDMFEGKAFHGGTFTGGLFQTSIYDNDGIKIDPTLGLRSYNSTGQLQFSISPTGQATFTGKVSSGFDPALQAVLSDSVFSNQPGVQFNIGVLNATQPFVTGWATNNDFPWGEGMLHMSSARTGIDPPAEVFLARNGTWQIGKPLARIYSAGNYLELIRDDAYLRMHADYNSLWYGSAVGGGRAFLTQKFGLTQIYSASIELGGSVTVQGDFGVTGSKNFIMDHPTKPGMQLVHGSTESPISGVEYWGCGVLGAGGTGTFHLPEYFTALVKPNTSCVSVNGNGAVVGWGDIIDNSVTVTGPAGTKYSWLVKAERTGGDFDVERIKPAPSEPAVPPTP